MQQSSYPYLFQTSDSSSLTEQYIYICLSRIDFFFIIIAAFFSGFSLTSQSEIYKCYAIATLIALILSFCFKLIIQIGRWDRKWFDTRAVAESAKTATWRYIIGSEPYKINMDAKQVDEKFVTELNEILEARADVSKSLAKGVGTGQQITDKMREIRKMDLQNRKNLYLKQRVQDQKDWYNKKSRYNSKRETIWFWATIGTEILAILSAIYILTNLSIAFNPIGMLTTIVVVFSAWTQLKKHRELSQSYALAAQELSAVESMESHVKDENELSDYVISAENAISKEHTMWCAKRI